MNVTEILERAVKERASDIFVVAGSALRFKIEGGMESRSENILKPDDTMDFVQKIYELAKRDMKSMESGDDDFSFSLPGAARFRVNVYRQRGSVAAILRVVLFTLPDYKELGIPETVMELSNRTGGLILVTGPAGSGKSTTLACMLDRINESRSGHIMTLEDPIEYLHRHKKSIVSQREVSIDTESYVRGLKAALRQAPDVILIGEMRDAETINIAMTAAETGHLVLSTLHTLGCANSVDRIIDAFPPQQQQQVRVQLSMVLQAVVSQQLVPSKKGGRAAAFEVLKVTPAVRNLIRESKMHQLDTVMLSGKSMGMQTMDAALLELYRKGEIEKEDVLSRCMNYDAVSRQL